MAISSSVVWEVQTGGSDANNSGGFRGGAYISAPSAPTVTPSGSGGTVAAATYYVVVTYTDGLGDTVISGQTAVTTSGATASFTVTSPGASTGALTWNCYVGTTSGGPYFPQGTALVIGSNRVVTTTPPTTGTQPRGVDRSLATSRQVVIDNSTITATTTGANSNTLTFTAGYVPSGADVGNTCRLTAGTNINAGDYEITAITSTTWTLTGAANVTTAGGAGSAIVGGMGGCFASPGQAAAFAVAQNIIYLKSGTYTIANGTNNTAGNKFTLSAQINLIGYSTNRNPFNTDTKPVLDAGAASMTMFTTSGNPSGFYRNVSFTNSGANASVTAIAVGGITAIFEDISINSCAIPLLFSQNENTFVRLYMNACGAMTSGARSDETFINCVAVNSTAAPFGGGTHWEYEECIAYNCATASGTFLIGAFSVARNCIAYGSSGAGGQGFAISTTSNPAQLENCIAYGCSGKGFSLVNSPGIALYNCAAGGNTPDFDTTVAAYQKINCVTLTAPPFTNPAGGDFSPNNAAGGGALLRAAGIPGTFPGLSTTGYRDIGAAQTSLGQPGAGGAMHLAGRGGGLVA